MKFFFFLLFSLSLLVSSLFTPRSLGGVGLASPVHAVSCLRSDSGDTLVNSACTLDGVPKYDGSGNETSRVGIINGGDLTISGADATVQPNTVIVWPLGKAINIQNGARLILGSGASLTQAEPLTYQFQTLGFTVNAAGDPVKVVNNVLQVCTNTTCSVSPPAGTGHAVVEGQLKVGSTFIIDGSGNVGVGSTSPGVKLDINSGSVVNGGNVTGIRLLTNNCTGPETNMGSLIQIGVGTESIQVGGIRTICDGGMDVVLNYMDVSEISREGLRIKETGNVGIGTTNPGAKLEVVGNINSTTGAIQTGSVTRIDNNGVGTFAAGTTIGGSAVTAAVVDVSLADGRLTLTSGTPVTTSDVTAATTIYYTPYKGDRISLYDGSSTWTTLTFSELSLALTNYTANTNYDIWAYNNSGTVALESTAWTNDTTRATAITRQNGVWVKSGATTRRLLGTIRITGTTGQTEDSAQNRLVFNVNNRVNKRIGFTYTSSWTETGSTTYWRYFGNDSTKFMGVVRSLDEDVIDVSTSSSRNVTADYSWAYIAITIDTLGSSTNDNILSGPIDGSGQRTGHSLMQARYVGLPGIGYRKIIPSVYISHHSYYGGAITVNADWGTALKGGANGVILQ